MTMMITIIIQLQTNKYFEKYFSKTGRQRREGMIFFFFFFKNLPFNTTLLLQSLLVSRQRNWVTRFPQQTHRKQNSVHQEKAARTASAEFTVISVSTGWARPPQPHDLSSAQVWG